MDKVDQLVSDKVMIEEKMKKLLRSATQSYSLKKVTSTYDKITTMLERQFSISHKMPRTEDYVWSNMLALTPISPFRPRRWRGAILPDKARISLRVLDAAKRPVSAVADQREFRDVAEVSVAIDRARELTLLFDPEHALDDRITMEQFIA